MATGGGDAAQIATPGFTPRAARLRPLPDGRSPFRGSITLAWTILLMAVGAGLAQLVLLTVTASPLRTKPPEPTPLRLQPTPAATAMLPPPRTVVLAATPTETPIPATPAPTPTAPAAQEEHPIFENPEMEPYVRLMSALEAMPNDTAAEDLDAIAETWSGTAAAYEAHLTLARYFRDRGDTRATANYEAALALDRPLDVRLEWAAHLESAGRTEDAYPAFKDVARRFPAASIPAMLRLAADPLVLAADFLELGFYREALAAVPPGGSAAELRLRAQSLARLRRYEEALGEFERWLLLEPDAQEARLGRAQNLVRLGRMEEGLAAYGAVSGATGRLGEAQVLSALGRREEAIEGYLALSSGVGWWSAAGLLERMGRAGEALPHYGLTAASTSFLADDAAYRLWVLSRNLGNTEYQSQAESYLENKWPNYYTLLARNQDFSVVTAPALPAVDHLALRRAGALAATDRTDWAVRELVLASRTAQDPALRMALSNALFDLGGYRASQWIAERELLAEGVTPLLAWRMAYPEAYPEAVRAASLEFGLQPILIWSVMRQESRYDPDAISRANAHGLMQVVPSTRDEIGRALGVPADHESMFNPSISIRFGAYFLSQMLQRFGGDLELAVAAYNGGGGTVTRSLADPLVSSRDDFYRWLTLSEPREFLNRVMLNYRVYEWLQAAA